MLTLAHYPTDAEFCRRALESLDRPAGHAVVGSLVQTLEEARSIPSIAARFMVEDVSAELHRSVNMELFERAAFDRPLAEALYALLGHVELHPLYPDVAVALASIHRAGVRIAVISDIHVDLRLHGVAFGIAADVDHWSLSFELGVQKPDPLMFTSALDALGVLPGEALMVGDRVSRDGAAATVGIDTLILPARQSYGPRGLDRVTRLVT